VGPFFSLALENDCGAYDSEFVRLSKKLGIPLVTSDRKIRKAFLGAALTPEEFLED
jgi:predicted nucleic acid-binding protein